MKTASVKKYTYEDYKSYRETFINDGMIPMPYIDWLRVQMKEDREGR